MTYIASSRPRHPVQVAELNDANAMRGLLKRMDEVMDDMTTAGARQGVMHARQIIIGSINATI